MLLTLEFLFQAQAGALEPQEGDGPPPYPQADLPPLEPRRGDPLPATTPPLQPPLALAHLRMTLALAKLQVRSPHETGISLPVALAVFFWACGCPHCLKREVDCCSACMLLFYCAEVQKPRYVVT